MSNMKRKDVMLKLIEFLEMQRAEKLSA